MPDTTTSPTLPNRITAESWGAPVLVDGDGLDLDASLAVWRHSPTGFAWGYSGSGPAQLALAILLRFTDADTAVALHQRFKFDHVARWSQAAPLDERVAVAGWIAAQVDRSHVDDGGLYLVRDGDYLDDESGQP
jgi:hypothetical protein